MEVVTYKKKVAFLALMIFIILNAYCCSASVIVKSNSSFRCSGRLDECSFEEELELDLLMNPYISRILAPAADYSKYKKPTPGVPGQLASLYGHDHDPYDVCIHNIEKKYSLCVKDNIFKRCGS